MSVWCIVYFFFFFKQKTAYEMLRSLVGSEMCIRDRDDVACLKDAVPKLLLIWFTTILPTFPMSCIAAMLSLIHI